jgi:hypothetical protein
MKDSEHEGFRKVSELKKGEQVSFSPERYTELLDIRVEAGRVRLLTTNPITGLPIEIEYDPDDLVLVKKTRVSRSR